MLAKEYHPDLIILDVMLPDINGQAVCELIRRDPTMSDIKIICISGMVEEDKIDDLRKSGADDFLHKPLDIDELIRRICRLLDMETSAGRLSRVRHRLAVRPSMVSDSRRTRPVLVAGWATRSRAMRERHGSGRSPITVRVHSRTETSVRRTAPSRGGAGASPHPSARRPGW